VGGLDAVEGFEVITNGDEEVFDALDGFAFGAFYPTWEPEIEGFEHESICGAEGGRLEKLGSFSMSFWGNAWGLRNGIFCLCSVI